MRYANFSDLYLTWGHLYQARDIMLTFIHLSDLHFTASDAGSQFDQDLEIRDKLLEDLRSRDISGLTGILVSGDIAFGGRKPEYEMANEWFEAMRKQVNIPPEAVFFIPGNHDVDREHLKPGEMLWDSHQTLRSISSENARDSSLKAKLKDGAFDFLLPLKEYRNFAAQHGRFSETATDQLAWESELTTRLEDGTPLVLHGLNSAIVSDKADTRANLLLGPFQFARLAKRREAINLVMCHHPPSWLLDCNNVEDRFHKHAHIVLTGHEHQSRCFQSGPGLRVCAGAVHPTRGESEWNPGYNIVRVAIEMEPSRTLVTRVETRTWHKTKFEFVATPLGDQTNEYVHRQALPKAAGAKPAGEANLIALAQTETQRQNVKQEASNEDAAFDAAMRRLILHFFQLGILDRLKCALEAGVWDEGDDSFEGQAKWARVFHRAQQTNHLLELWNAVAKRNPNLAQLPNPFTH